MPASISDKATKSYSFLSKSLSSGISDVDTTIPLNNVTNIPTDTAVHFVIDRVDSNGNTTPSARELCKGVVSGGNLINCTRGLHGTTAQSHSSGAVVEFTASAVGWNELIDAVIAEHSQVDGTHSTSLITSRTEDTAPDGSADFVLTYDNSGSALKKVKPDNLVRNNTQLNSGWITGLLPSVSSVTANGNRSYTVAFGSSISSTLSPGMRIRATRTVTAPTTVFSLDGSNDYYNDTTLSGMTATDDMTFSAWVRMTSYPASSCGIITRFNGTSGFVVRATSTGQIQVAGFSGGIANYRGFNSYQSIPLNKWVHITAQLDMSSYTATSTTMYCMMDGVDVPISLIQSGTNPTSFIQAGNLEIGSENGGTTPFAGQITDVMIFNAKVTQATMRGYMSQKPTGSETSLISAYSNGSTTDLNTGNANNLTAQNGATTSTSYAPYGVNSFGTPVGTYEYGIVTGLASSTDVYVQVPEGCAIPTSGGVSAVDLSSVKVPYGFPAQVGRWVVETHIKTNCVQNSPVNGTWYNLTSTSGTSGGSTLSVPIGDWSVGYSAVVQSGKGSNDNDVYITLSTANNTESNVEFTNWHYTSNTGATGSALVTGSYRERPLSVSAATIYYLNSKTSVTAANINNRGDQGTTQIFAKLAHL